MFSLEQQKSGKDKEKEESCHSLLSSLVFIASLLHVLVTTVTSMSRNAHNGVTRHINYLLQEESSEGPRNSLVIVYDRKALVCEELLLKGKSIRNRIEECQCHGEQDKKCQL